MIRTALFLALAFPGIAFASQQRTDGATDERADEPRPAHRIEQRIEKRDARDRGTRREDRAGKAERDYWRFVAEHEIDADLAYDDEDRR